MKITNTKLSGCYVIENSIFEDDRGYFLESFNEKKFNDLIGNDIKFVQDNQSVSVYGVLRGLHFQKNEHAQSKLVRVLKGHVRDVVVDLREGSPTYGEKYMIDLTESNNLQLFVPKGFAHGFVVYSKTATFFYKCDNYYNKESESGLIYNDKTINIDWGIKSTDMIISEKDLELPNFSGILPQHHTLRT